MSTLTIAPLTDVVVDLPGPFRPIAPPFRRRAKAPQLTLRATPDRVADETPRETLRHLELGHPVVAAQGNPSLAYRFTKRLLDIVGAAALIVLLSPLLLSVFLVLLATTRGRPLFCQQRVGLGGRLFPMLKFRTMRRDAEKLRHLVKNEKVGPIFKNRRDPRITRIGRLLRRSSIDELPQLLSVLAGHMSLVGPRPPIAQEVAKYEIWQRRRLAVRPGLTCLWQVSGRSDVGFEDWVRMDLWYVKHQSLWTDLTLLWKTPLCVISCRGAY